MVVFYVASPSSVACISFVSTSISFSCVFAQFCLISGREGCVFAIFKECSLSLKSVPKVCFIAIMSKLTGMTLIVLSAFISKFYFSYRLTDEKVSSFCFFSFTCLPYILCISCADSVITGLYVFFWFWILCTCNVCNLMVAVFYATKNKYCVQNVIISKFPFITSISFNLRAHLIKTIWKSLQK